MENLFFLVADGSAKLPGRDYEFQEPTLRREFTVRRENLSGESHGDREEFQPEESEDDAEARKNFWSIQEDFIYRHHIEPRVQLYVLKEESFPIPLKYIDVISEQLKTKRWLLECRRKQKSVRFVDGLHKNYIIERNSSERKCMVQEETDKIETRSHMTWRLDKNWKTKTSVAKTRIQFYWYCRRKTEFCIALQLLRTNSFRWKDPKEALHLNYLSRWKQAHVVSSRGTAYLWDKILRVTLKTRRVRDTLKCEPGKQGVQTLDVVLFSELREIENYVWFRRFWRSLSQRRKPRQTERECAKDLSLPSNVNSRCKGSSGQGMKGGHKRAHKTTIRKVHFAALMDIRHIQKYEYIPENVSKNNLKCGPEYEHIPECSKEPPQVWKSFLWFMSLYIQGVQCD